MFANFIYIIIVILIYATYQPPEVTNFPPFETGLLFCTLIGLFAYLNRKQFQKLYQEITRGRFARLDHRFNLQLTRQSVLAILLFVVNIYGLNLPAFVSGLPGLSKIPTLQALIFLGLFLFFMAIVWACAYDAYRRIYSATISKKTYVWSNISFSVPILLPWILLSGVSDLIQALPFAAPKQFLSTTEGQVTYFLIFLLAVAMVGPAMIQRFWRCTPLQEGSHRRRIEQLCAKAGIEYANILHWPIFGGRMITAGVMGLIKKFRYILVTDALLHYLSPDEIEAVIAHEIGHVKRKHLLFYLLFFSGYMLISYATFDLIIYAIIFTEPLLQFFTRLGINQSTLTSVSFSLVIILIFLIYFRYIFGYFMRNFERQADCYVYTLFDNAKPLISTLQKIALTSGQPPDRPNWHHFSIKERIGYLEKCEADRSSIARHDGKLRKSMAIYLLGLILVGGIGYSLNFGATGAKLSKHFFEKVILREIEKKPDSPNLYKMLGDLYYSTENYIGVKNAYETSIDLEPNNAEVLNNLAWLYATCPDEKLRNPFRALQLAEKAVELQISPHILDTLAESYYINGMYNEAIVAETRALKLVKGNRSYYEQQLQKFQNAGKEAGE
ncbi:MAG: M48 family metalloprotease [Desulfobacterales bacterium]|jgi:Zn-dependent protease with chaperone function